MAVHICKIAFKTIPRCGIAALILLCMGLYFLFPACAIFRQIQTEKNTPFELTATTDSGNIDLNTLMQIEGVERISPVINLSATLSLDDYKLDCEIKAVHSSFLSLKFTEGTMYPDNSNMPYLILNKTAAKSFARDHQTVPVSLEDTVVINTNGKGRKAVVCGIFDDASEAPTVYMSYDLAQKLYGSPGQAELVFLLADKGAAEHVVSALRRQNIYADFDSSILLAWELLQKQCWQTFLLSLGLLACAAVLIRERRLAEIGQRRSEQAVLLLSGMTADAVGSTYPLRIALAEISCLILAAMVSAFTGTFSLMAVAAGVFCMGILGVTLLIPQKRVEV